MYLQCYDHILGFFLISWYVVWVYIWIRFPLGWFLKHFRKPNLNYSSALISCYRSNTLMCFQYLKNWKQTLTLFQQDSGSQADIKKRRGTPHTHIHMHVFISSSYIAVLTHCLPRDKSLLFILKTAAWPAKHQPLELEMKNFSYERATFPFFVLFFIPKQKIVLLLLWASLSARLTV